MLTSYLAPISLFYFYHILRTIQTTSIPAILLNMLGSFAKAWNYEGEELLRQQKDVDYTIIRPGVMSTPTDNAQTTGKVLLLNDNGNDLPVTPIQHSDIANLCIECLKYPNTARSTLSAMKVKQGKDGDATSTEGEETYGPLLAKVKPDMTDFPYSLMEENEKSVRKGVVVLGGVVTVLLSGIIKLLTSLIFT